MNGRVQESREGVEPDRTLANEITQRFSRIEKGDRAAEAEVALALYEHLHGCANQLMRREVSGHTLSPTAVVHEAWLKLTPNWPRGLTSRKHLVNLLVRNMERVLVDHSKARTALKRGGGRRAVTHSMLDEIVDAMEAGGRTLVDIEAAIRALEIDYEGVARCVRLRFFGGLTVEEVCRVEGLPRSRVESDWRFARSFLKTRLRGYEVEGA